MNQPELGRKMNEVRCRKGITQKDLSESCNIDIRTIQRIEAGEVIPRGSTLKLIGSKLDCNFVVSEKPSDLSFIRNILLISFVAGLINFINWFFYTGLIPLPIMRISFAAFIILSVIYVISVAIVYYGFFYLGRHQKNKLLKISSVIVIGITYLYVATDLVVKSGVFPPLFIDLNRIILIVSNANGILFGIALLVAHNPFSILYKVTGILHLTLVPLFFFSDSSINLVGCWLAVFYFLLLTLILFIEYRFYKSEGI